MKISPSEAVLIQKLTLQITSEAPIEELRDKMPALCEHHHFALLQTYVYHEIVENKGFPIERPVYVYEICQAKVAASMLTKHPIFSVFMPCRIALYREEEKTVVATFNMTGLLESIRSEEDLFAETSAVFETIIAIMKSLSS